MLADPRHPVSLNLIFYFKNIFSILCNLLETSIGGSGCLACTRFLLVANHEADF